jgi:hypothetical protein
VLHLDVRDSVYITCKGQTAMAYGGGGGLRGLDTPPAPKSRGLNAEHHGVLHTMDKCETQVILNVFK